MTKFEKVSRFKDIEFDLPVRKTKNSAGYDFVVAEDIVIPTCTNLNKTFPEKSSAFPALGTKLTLSEAKDYISRFNEICPIKPTLVSTGVKCYLEPDQYLELSVRSSTPLKYLLILANGVGRLLF
jgi:dUTP pyrophosphatase